MYDENRRLRGESQEDYCSGCAIRDLCNVILRDDEDCEDRIFDSTIPNPLSDGWFENND
jgi:hypothetical protein